ncbi:MULTISPECIES: PqqD family protein [unclassified Mesorhizobium]|uniref:PqqD family protein n=1 Tax=unclassified Mesorhizobium TaxID=325217 RepID=UPI000F7557D4|nr:MULTISPECIES: PqqD family protein [unclassified Mesorhizobium]AZO56899.1 PqqD family protein [Mesorhizobium sp. M8A.F.Ca.ET.057.01.1.1]RWE48265.1 MAG: PqqD family protein [Mesorhizobium sp.]TJX51581.1 MAG: PqqD family protein [Mesorhizobium sp.]
MKHEPHTYAVASRDIVFESFDGEAVVLNLANGKYFGFSDSGSKVWLVLSSGVDAQALIGLAAGGSTISQAELEHFISQLLELGLLVRSEAAAQPLPGELQAELAATNEPLNVSIHDDLADLIVVDPIHEVEEPLGWPAVKQAS